MGDWEDRQLCEDGACVGVIGDDGKCTVCGKAGNSGPRAPGLGPRSKPEPEPESDSEAQSPKPKAQSPEHADDWDHRTLCPDGACTGVIGADGKCSVCGRSAA